MGNADYISTLPIMVVLATIHPALKRWVKSGRISNADVVKRHDTNGYILVLTLTGEDTDKQLSVPMASVPLSGSVTKREIAMVDAFKAIITDEVVAKIALSL